MPSYLVSGVTPAGSKVTELLEAASADAVVKTLRDRGYEQIVLHTDDVAAQCMSERSVDRFLSPRECVNLRYQGPLGRYWLFVRKCYGQGPGHLWFRLLILPLIVLIWRRVADRPWGFIDVGLLVCSAIVLLVPVLLPLLVSARAMWFGRLARYLRLVEARAWGRWEEVLRLLPRMRAELRPYQAALFEARALAGLGRVDEALRVVEPFADGREVPKRRYWSGLAGIYFAARRKDESLAAMEKAWTLAPDDPLVSADLALSLLRRRCDTDRAEQLLTRARSHAISDHGDGMIQRVEGMLALERGNLHEARRLLEESLRKESAIKLNPLARATVDKIHASLAVCHALQGDRASALKHFRRAEPRLRALAEDELLERCQEALGVEN
jgi:hypothetical protein